MKGNDIDPIMFHRIRPSAAAMDAGCHARSSPDSHRSWLYKSHLAEMASDSKYDAAYLDEITAVNNQLSVVTLISPPPPSCDAQTLPTLPFDLIAEILCRLPVKLLLQLRCVCKFWNYLISHPKFAKKHLSMSTTRWIHFVGQVRPTMSNKYAVTSTLFSQR